MPPEPSPQTVTEPSTFSAANDSKVEKIAVYPAARRREDGLVTTIGGWVGVVRGVAAPGGDRAVRLERRKRVLISVPASMLCDQQQWLRRGWWRDGHGTGLVAVHGDTSAALGERVALEHHLLGRGAVVHARERTIEVLRVAVKAPDGRREARAVVDGRVHVVVDHRRVHAALESEHRRHLDAAA
eukprot:scaffold110084_cov60-Phaeocystis_antarctica.AAC.2